MILRDAQRRALEFIHAANTGGYRPTHFEVEEWRLREEPQPGKRGELIREAQPSAFQTRVATNFADVLAPSLSKMIEGMRLSGIYGTPAEYEPDGPAESFLASLVRLRWLSESVGGERQLALTDLGRALLRAEQQQDDDRSDVLILVKDDVMAYAALVGRVADLDDPMIVDPYLRADQMLSFLRFTTTGRFLIGPDLRAAEVSAMQVLIEGSQWAVKPELRRAAKGVLHDRFIVSDSAVYTLGISMNAVGQQKTTVLMPLPDYVAAHVRTETEEHWVAAEVLAPVVAPASTVEEEPERD